MVRSSGVSEVHCHGWHAALQALWSSIMYGAGCVVEVGVQGDRVGDIEIRVLVFECGIALHNMLSWESGGSLPTCRCAEVC